IRQITKLPGKFQGALSFAYLPLSLLSYCNSKRSTGGEALAQSSVGLVVAPYDSDLVGLTGGEALSAGAVSESCQGSSCSVIGAAVLVGAAGSLGYIDSVAGCADVVPGYYYL